MSLIAPRLFAYVPAARREHLRKMANRLRHPFWMGTLRRTNPVSRWAWERGTPVDRFYIESFLKTYTSDIHGHVLEVKDARYTRCFGSGVTHSDVLDISAENPEATIVADLTAAEQIEDARFDCFILTQTLQYIFEPARAIDHARRILRPGGTLLVTVPAIMRKDDIAVDFWRFTADGCRELFSRCFGRENVAVETRGNLLTSVAFLNGLAHEDLRASELECNDPSYPVLICVRAVKV